MKVIKGGKDKAKPRKTYKHYDRDAIAKDIIAGMLSTREIGRKHGCSHTLVVKTKKERGIETDLSNRVRATVRAKLVSRKPKVSKKKVYTRREQEQLESEAIEDAAKEGVRIVTRHRRIIEKCSEVANQFLAELKADRILKITDEGKEVWTKIPARQKSALFNAVTIAVQRLIPLERQSFNLDETPTVLIPGEGVLTAYPAGPLTLSEWETQMREADENREKINDSGA